MTNVLTGTIMKTVGDKILILPDPAETESPGGITLLEDDRVAIWATVECVGPDVKSVKDGDRILVAKYAGINIWEFTAIREDEVLIVAES